MLDGESWGRIEYWIKRALAAEKRQPQPFLEQVVAQAEQTRTLRDEHGWPEPRTVEELRRDPRYQLRNTVPDRPEDENLVLAAALLLLVAQDRLSGRPEKETP